jgi:hypothetical protein
MRFRSALLFVFLFVPCLHAEDIKYIRIARDEDKAPIALETSVTHYAALEGGVTLDLVAAVHIGDKAYYRKLNELFKKYDVVLYELVAPEGTRPPKGGKKDADNPLAMMQKGMKMVLRLEHQLEQVDYTKANFVHADLSPEGMAEAMKTRGDDKYTLVFGFAADMMRKQNLAADKPQQPQPQISLEDLLDAGKLKRQFAEQMANIDEDGGLGKTVNQLLVQDRNKACLKVFGQEIAKGKKKIAIFYGGAHMPDFDRRVREDYGLKMKGQDWIQAWNLE